MKERTTNLFLKTSLIAYSGVVGIGVHRMASGQSMGRAVAETVAGVAVFAALATRNKNLSGVGGELLADAGFVGMLGVGVIGMANLMDGTLGLTDIYETGVSMGTFAGAYALGKDESPQQPSPTQHS